MVVEAEDPLEPDDVPVLAMQHVMGVVRVVVGVVLPTVRERDDDRRQWPLLRALEQAVDVRQLPTIPEFSHLVELEKSEADAIARIAVRIELIGAGCGRRDVDDRALPARRSVVPDVRHLTPADGGRDGETRHEFAETARHGCGPPGCLCAPASFAISSSGKPAR